MTEPSSPPVPGDFPVVVRFPLRWGEMDALGHANNTCFFSWFESARIAYFDSVPLDHQTKGVGPILASTRCDFLRPVVYPADLVTGVRVIKIGTTSITMEYVVWVDEKPVARGESVIVLIDYRTMQKVAVPTDIRERIETLEKQRSTAGALASGTMTELACTLVTAEGARPSRFVYFLHGILGSGANWRSFARRLTAARPDWGAVLVDLRMHGASQAMAPPHTVAAAARDLVELEKATGRRADAIVGHSFGGKVTLAFVERRGGDLDRAFVLDATPGPRPTARGSETTVEVISTLRRVGASFPTRQEFLAAVTARGVARGIADWLAQNLERRGEGVRFRLDLDAIEALLDDYFALDLWEILESPPGRVAFDVVVGGKSNVFDAEDRARLARAAETSPDRLRVHVLPEAGHWVHVDDPDGLFAVVTGSM
jgi:esterase